MFLTLPIRNEKTAITRPIALKIASDLRKYLEIIPKATRILFLDEEGVRTEQGTSLGEFNQEGIDTNSNELISITVSEEYMDTTYLQYQHYDQEFKPIFGHPETGTHVTPYYSHTEMRMQFTYKAPSKAAAKLWLNTIKTKIRKYRDTYPHNLEYSYEINEQIMYVLTEVYRLVKNRCPETENISDWFKKHFNRRFGRLSDTAGINTIFAVSEVQQQVFGFFDFNGMIEEGEKVDGAQGWNVSFSYLVRYMKPTDISVWYPRVVYNQIVNAAMMGVDEEGDVDAESAADMAFPEDQLYYTQSGWWLEKYSSISKNTEYRYNWGIAVPRWIEFQPEGLYNIRGLHRFVDQLILFNPDDELGCELLDLKDPQGYKLDPLLTEFLVSEKDYMLEPGKSIFQITVWENNQMLFRDFIKITDEGKILLNGCFCIKKTYYIRIGLYHDWTFVDPAAIERLKRFGLDKGMFTFKDRYGYNDWQLGINSPGYHSELYFRIIDYISGNAIPQMPKNNDDWGNRNRNLFTAPKTVQVFWTTNKKKEK